MFIYMILLKLLLYNKMKKGGAYVSLECQWLRSIKPNRVIRMKDTEQKNFDF